VLRLIAEGKDTEEMASILGISPHTVIFHRRNLRQTLGIDSESGLLRIAMLFRVREELPSQ